MVNVIDRRNSVNKNKNISNRKRFIDRARDQVRESVNKKIADGKIADLAKGNQVKVKIKNTKEPTFEQDYETGSRDYVLPGNKNFEKGDAIAKPKSGGGSGKKAGKGEDSEDDFSFVLTREEYLGILFEDLELPDLIKKQLKDMRNLTIERKGFSTSGNPSSIDIQRTTKNAMGRRIALKRPKSTEIAELEKLIEQLESDSKPIDEIFAAKEQLRELVNKQKSIPFYDPVDLRYRRFEKVPNPITHAVMFCVMDVSGSMGEYEKDISKRFFLLLYLFLTTKYEKVDIRFVRHTTTADEVDEYTFFHDKLTGGTIISPALKLVNDIIDKDYDHTKTNIYIAQASDGDNIYQDNDACYEIVSDHLLPKIQYMAYIEIFNGKYSRQSLFQSDEEDEESDKGLWGVYKLIYRKFKQLQCRKIGSQKEIFSVFAELFRKKEDE